MALLKLKVLEEYLQDLQTFKNPKVGLEQYGTPPHLAACMLHTIQTKYGDIEGKMVADLGCGCGTLMFGCATLGAAACIGFDIDMEALKIFELNKSDEGFDTCDAVLCNVYQDLNKTWHGMFDTVVMNPPFGTRNKGSDIEFILVALSLAENVYSLHKTSTRDYIKRKISRLNVSCQVIAELKFDLPRTYKFHKQNSTDINVDLIRFSNNL